MRKISQMTAGSDEYIARVHAWAALFLHDPLFRDDSFLSHLIDQIKTDKKYQQLHASLKLFKKTYIKPVRDNDDPIKNFIASKHFLELAKSLEDHIEDLASVTQKIPSYGKDFHASLLEKENEFKDIVTYQLSIPKGFVTQLNKEFQKILNQLPNNLVDKIKQEFAKCEGMWTVLKKSHLGNEKGELFVFQLQLQTAIAHIEAAQKNNFCADVKKTVKAISDNFSQDFTPEIAQYIRDTQKSHEQAVKDYLMGGSAKKFDRSKSHIESFIKRLKETGEELKTIKLFEKMFEDTIKTVAKEAPADIIQKIKRDFSSKVAAYKTVCKEYPEKVDSVKRTDFSSQTGTAQAWKDVAEIITVLEEVNKRLTSATVVLPRNLEKQFTDELNKVVPQHMSTSEAGKVTQSFASLLEKYKGEFFQYPNKNGQTSEEALTKIKNDIQTVIGRITRVNAEFQASKQLKTQFSNHFKVVSKEIPEEEVKKIEQELLEKVNTHNFFCKAYLNHGASETALQYSKEAIVKFINKFDAYSQFVQNPALNFVCPSHFEEQFAREYKALVSHYIPQPASDKTVSDFKAALRAYKAEVHKHLVAMDKSDITALKQAETKVQGIIKSYQKHFTLLTKVKGTLKGPNILETEYIEKFSSVFEKMPSSIASKLQQEFAEAMAAYKKAIKDYLQGKPKNTKWLENCHAKAQKTLAYFSSIAERVQKIPTLTTLSYLALPDKLEAHIHNTLGSVPKDIKAALAVYRKAWDDYLDGRVESLVWLQYAHHDVQVLLAKHADIKDGFIDLRMKDFTSAFIASVEGPLQELINQLAKPVELNEEGKIKGLELYGAVTIENGEARSFPSIFLDYHRHGIEGLDWRRTNSTATGSGLNSYDAIQQQTDSVITGLQKEFENPAEAQKAIMGDMDSFSGKNNKINLIISALFAQTGVEKVIFKALQGLDFNSFGLSIQGADGGGIAEIVKDRYLKAINVNNEELIVRLDFTNNMNNTMFIDGFSQISNPPLIKIGLELKVNLKTFVAELSDLRYSVAPQDTTSPTQHLYLSPGYVKKESYKKHLKTFPNNLATFALMDEFTAYYFLGQYNKAFDILNRTIPQIESTETLVGAVQVLNQLFDNIKDSSADHYCLFWKNTISLIEKHQHYRASGLQLPPFELDYPNLEKKIRAFNPVNHVKRSMFSFAKLVAALNINDQLNLSKKRASDVNLTELNNLLFKANKDSSADEVTKITNKISDIEKQFDSLLKELSTLQGSGSVNDPYALQDAIQCVGKIKALIVSVCIRDKNKKLEFTHRQKLDMQSLSNGQLAETDYPSEQQHAIAATLKEHMATHIKLVTDLLPDTFFKPTDPKQEELSKQLGLAIARVQDTESRKNIIELFEELKHLFTLIQSVAKNNAQTKPHIDAFKLHFVQDVIQDKHLWQCLNEQQQQAIIRVSPGAAALCDRTIALRVLQDDTLVKQLRELKPNYCHMIKGWYHSIAYADSLLFTFWGDLTVYLRIFELGMIKDITVQGLKDSIPELLGFSKPNNNTVRLGSAQKITESEKTSSVRNLKFLITLEKEGHPDLALPCKTKNDLYKLILLSKGHPEITTQLLLHMLGNSRYNHLNINHLIQHTLVPPRNTTQTQAKIDAAVTIKQALGEPTLAKYLLNSELLEQLSSEQLTQLAVLDNSGDIARELLSDEHTRWFTHGKLQWHACDALSSYSLGGILKAHHKKEDIVSTILQSQAQTGFLNAVSRLFTLIPDTIDYKSKLSNFDIAILFEQEVKFDSVQVNRIIRSLSDMKPSDNIDPFDLLIQTASDQTPLARQLITQVSQNNLLKQPLAKQLWKKLVSKKLEEKQPDYVFVVWLKKLDPLVYKELAGETWIYNTTILNAMNRIISHGSNAQYHDLFTKQIDVLKKVYAGGSNIEKQSMEKAIVERLSNQGSNAAYFNALISVYNRLGLSGEGKKVLVDIINKGKDIKPIKQNGKIFTIPGVTIERLKKEKQDSNINLPQIIVKQTNANLDNSKTTPPVVKEMKPGLAAGKKTSDDLAQDQPTGITFTTT